MYHLHFQGKKLVRLLFGLIFNAEDGEDRTIHNNHYEDLKLIISPRVATDNINTR